MGYMTRKFAKTSSKCPKISYALFNNPLYVHSPLRGLKQEIFTIEYPAENPKLCAARSEEFLK